MGHGKSHDYMIVLEYSISPNLYHGRANDLSNRVSQTKQTMVWFEHILGLQTRDSNGGKLLFSQQNTALQLFSVFSLGSQTSQHLLLCYKKIHNSNMDIDIGKT